MRGGTRLQGECNSAGEAELKAQSGGVQIGQRRVRAWRKR